MLPDPAVKARIQSLAVGLSVDPDDPEMDVLLLLSRHFPNPIGLPCGAFVTHDLRWVDGFTDFEGKAADFAKVLDRVEASPVIRPSAEGQKRLEELLAAARKGAEKADWAPVLRAAREARGIEGLCPERKGIAEADGKARAWAEERLAGAVRIAQEGGDLAPARKGLLELKKPFAGEPEAAEAEAGLKALLRLSNILTVEAGGTSVSPKGLREKAAAEYAGSRWSAAFERRPAPASVPAPR